MSRAIRKLSKNDRQNQIKRILSHTGQETALSISEIRERLEELGYKETRKNVERDVLDFTLAYPLQEVGNNPRRFYFDGDFKMNFELVFDEDQLQTIILALGSLKQMSPSVLKSLCGQVENTLVSKLPSALSKEFEHLKSISHSAPTALGEGSEIEEEVFHNVMVALRKGKVFECQYENPEAETVPKRKRRFAPLKLHFAGVPYIYVYDLDGGENIKILRLSRIHHAKLTDIDVKSERAEEINLDYVFGGYGRGDEEVIHYAITCLAPMAQRFRENRIHASQKIEVLSAGEFRITFSLHDSLEIPRLLAQYGEFITKIEPESAYEKVKLIWKAGLGAA
jgi:predicted DNA-binding transcriptional regulator YafY